MFIQEYAGISKQKWKLDYHVEYYFLLYIVAEVQSLQNNTDSPKANFQSNIAFKCRGRQWRIWYGKKQREEGSVRNHIKCNVKIPKQETIWFLEVRKVTKHHENTWIMKNLDPKESQNSKGQSLLEGKKNKISSITQKRIKLDRKY